MQFIANGPDIPNEMLYAHEEGKLVLFCGAGISYPAGLPDFKGLVEAIYKHIGTSIEDSEHEKIAFKEQKYDLVLGLLEQRVPGNYSAIRPCLIDILRPKTRRKGAVDTHKALLQLSRTSGKKLRLVTTNYDHLFHIAAKRLKILRDFNYYAAPLLPIPKENTWDGIVYLHGLLPMNQDKVTDFNKLVLTSGDFGLAYLTERWASRFMSKLLKNYDICFVGYSVNDPIMRYITDAIAADKILGEFTNRIWAFVDCTSANIKTKKTEWDSKGIEPIFYDIAEDNGTHNLLHSTLKTWAGKYVAEIAGASQIVAEHAHLLPLKSTPQDDFEGRMLWALSDKSGEPAKLFADMTPSPSLEWLFEVFSKNSFQRKDFPRFCVQYSEKDSTKDNFSLVRRPPTWSRAQKMVLVNHTYDYTEWDSGMHHIGRWLTRHLNNPQLIIWIAENGGQLHYHLKWKIEGALKETAILEQSGEKYKLNNYKACYPDGIPCLQMRKLWGLVLGGHLKSEPDHFRYHHWKNRTNAGFTPASQMELRKILAPKIILRKPYRLDTERGCKVTSVKDLVTARVELACANPKSIAKDFRDKKWLPTMPRLLNDFQQLLIDTLNLMNELELASEQWDLSVRDMPSIEDHWQNRGYRDWAFLIELLRDAWCELNKHDPKSAAKTAQSWLGFPYPVFKRLALFAASKCSTISDTKWTSWLLVDKGKLLWSVTLKREICRLFAERGKGLTSTPQNRLIRALISEAKKNEDTSKSYDAMLYLKKLKHSGITLNDTSKKFLSDAKLQIDKISCDENQREEFSRWFTTTGDPGFKVNWKTSMAPNKRKELIEWLKQHENQKSPYENGWYERCSERFFLTFSCLVHLAKEKEVAHTFWSNAFSAWSAEKKINIAWLYTAQFIHSMPGSFIQGVARDISSWIKSAAREIECHKSICFSLCRRILELPYDNEGFEIRDGEGNLEPVSSAINHPVGQVTQALIYLWLSDKPNDSDGLTSEFKNLFTCICDTNVNRFRHSRIILSTYLITLFRVDQKWTEDHLLPLFNWNDILEATCAWEGFLRSPRLHPTLLKIMKAEILATTRHYDQLIEHHEGFTTFFTFAVLKCNEYFNPEEIKSAIRSLPQRGINEVVQALGNALSNSKHKATYWNTHISLFWKSYWPKDKQFASPEVARALSEMVIEVGDSFPQAFNLVQHWLVPFDQFFIIPELLLKTNLCSKFPDDAIHFLDKITSPESFVSKELKECLKQISSSKPELKNDKRFKKLYTLA